MAGGGFEGGIRGFTVLGAIGKKSHTRATNNDGTKTLSQAAFVTLLHATWRQQQLHSNNQQQNGWIGGRSYHCSP